VTQFEKQILTSVQTGFRSGPGKSRASGKPSAAKTIVSASEKAVAVVALRNVEQIKAASQAPKKTLKLSTLVSSLLQVYPSPIFNCGIRVRDDNPIRRHSAREAKNLFNGIF
jgi:hypothetical protein